LISLLMDKLHNKNKKNISQRFYFIFYIFIIYFGNKTHKIK
jgi:hypothetical protein